MVRFFAIALFAVLAAPAAWGQSLAPDHGLAPADSWRIPHEGPLPQLKFALPVSDYVAADGSRSRQRGIVAGVEVAPETVVGIGFFHRQPKRSGPDAAPDPNTRRSRKAAVGVSLRF